MGRVMRGRQPGTTIRWRKARLHVSAKRADVSDAVEPMDDFDAFLQAQIRRTREKFTRAVQRVSQARADERRIVDAEWQIHGRCLGYGGPSHRWSDHNNGS